MVSCRRDCCVSSKRSVASTAFAYLDACPRARRAIGRPQRGAPATEAGHGIRCSINPRRHADEDSLFSLQGSDLSPLGELCVRFGHAVLKPVNQVLLNLSVTPPLQEGLTRKPRYASQDVGHTVAVTLVRCALSIIHKPIGGNQDIPEILWDSDEDRGPVGVPGVFRHNRLPIDLSCEEGTAAARDREQFLRDESRCGLASVSVLSSFYPELNETAEDTTDDHTGEAECGGDYVRAITGLSKWKQNRRHVEPSVVGAVRRLLETGRLADVEL